MPIRRSLALVAPLLAVPALLIGQAPNVSLPDQQRRQVDAVFSRYDKPGSPGCALGVMRDGQLAYGRGYGSADLEHGVPITTSSLFDVGSVSKQFAAASIALLAEEHKLSFSDDVRKYIPELPNYGGTITIDNLMHHTSGLRDYNGLLDLAGHDLIDVTTDSQALAVIVRQRHLNFPTGSRYEYSNTGYFLLSVIVQRVTGQSLATFARERLFVPLGMTHTLYRDHYAMLIPNRAMGYAPNDTGKGAQGREAWKNSMSNWEETGDGAVHLSIEDALKWDENFYHPRVGGQWMVEQLQGRGVLANGDSISYARGLDIVPYRGLRRVQHGGSWIGYRANFARFPEQHTSIVILCNVDGSAPGRLSDQVADIVLDGKFPVAKQSAPVATRTAAATSDGMPLASVTGTYFDTLTNDVIRITEKNGAPVLGIFGQSLPLVPTGPTTFAVTGAPASVAFMSDGQRPASALRLKTGSADGNVAVRFTPAAPSGDALRAYTGSYYSPELDVTWPITLENGHLVLTRTTLDPDIAGQLDPAMTDAFTAAGGFIRFTRDQAGQVNGFELSASRMRGIRFDRRAP